MRISYLQKFLFSLLLFSFSFGFSQVSNDVSCSPDYLGKLADPIACPNGSSNMYTVSGGSTLFALAESYKPTLQNCLGIAVPNGMDDLSPDVWYKFEASGTDLEVNLGPVNSNIIQKPIIGIYKYTGHCMNPVPLFCFSSGTSSISTVFKGMKPGTEYLIQITGTGANDKGDFKLQLRNFNACNQCASKYDVGLLPLPSSGGYNPGDTVQFTFELSGYKSIGEELKAVTFDIGNSWIPNFHGTVAPVSVSGNGSWSFSSGITTPSGVKSGFVFTHSLGLQQGDAGTVFSKWKFIFKLPVGSCSLGKDLTVKMRTWSTKQIQNQPGSCSNDPEFFVKPFLRCCSLTFATNIQVVNPQCQNSVNGSISVQIPNSGTANVSLYQEGSLTGTISNVSFTNPAIFSNLSAGIYLLQISSTSGTCNVFKSIKLKPAMTYLLSQNMASCPDKDSCVFSFNYVSGPTPFNFKWYNQSGNVISTTTTAFNQPGNQWYYFSCNYSTCAVFDSLFVESLPRDTAYFSYSPYWCNLANLIVPNYVEIPGGTFSFSGSTTGQNLSIGPSTGGIVIPTNLSPGLYYIKYTTNGACPDTDINEYEVIAKQNVTVTYPALLCTNDPAGVVLPVISGNTVPGSFYNVPSGIVMDTATGQINLSSSLPGQYVLFYKTNSGSTLCEGYASDTIMLSDTCRVSTGIVTPYTSFTPNGDNVNDTWFITGIDGIKNRVYVFNRWGQSVWSTKEYHNHNNAWNGRDLKGNTLVSGTYYYVIYDEKNLLSKGWVELLNK